MDTGEEGPAVAVVESVKGKVELGLEGEVVYVNLHGATVQSSHLKCLQAFSHLQHLNLFDTPANDSDVAGLARLVELRKLDLGRTRVSDAGLPHLRGCATSPLWTWPAPR
jgi:hypothetical protein